MKICERVLLGGDDVGCSHRLLKHAVELVQKLLAMSKQIFCGLLWFWMGDLMGLLGMYWGFNMVSWGFIGMILGSSHTATGSTDCRLWFQVDLVIAGLQVLRIWLVPIWLMAANIFHPFSAGIRRTLMFSASQNVTSLQVDIKQRKRALLLVIWQEWCPAKGYHTIPTSATSKAGIQRSGKRWKPHPTHIIHQLYKRYPQLHMGCKPP